MATLPQTPDLFETARSLGIAVAPLTPTLGAEIAGLDLDRPLTAAEREWLHAAWLHFKVVVFRDQDISHESHIRLGEYFGALERHPVLPHVAGYPEILRIGSEDLGRLAAATRARFQACNTWSSDMSFRQQPPVASILRARILPSLGGDTLWTDAAAAYAGLPHRVKERIDGAEAEHDILRFFGGRVGGERRAQLARDFPAVRHPVVRVHPETGEKILYVNHSFTTRILGMSEEASDSLLRLLFDRIKVPEYQLRFRWTPNAIGLCDNRATQHYAVGDHWPEHRLFERVTVARETVMR